LPLYCGKLEIEIHHSANPLTSREALPSPIFIRLHRVQAFITGDPFVHRIKVAQILMEDRTGVRLCFLTLIR
jgi:hypothetical protein